MKAETLFRQYLADVDSVSQQPDAREESYYDSVKRLIEGLGKLRGSDIRVTILPKKTEAGSPDFCIRNGSYQVVGYIEAKAPGTNLDDAEKSEQIQRYQKAFPNLILTNFREFRLYRTGKFLLKTSLKDRKVSEQLFDNFLSFTISQIEDPKELAEELAKRTRFLCDQVILPGLKEEVEQQRGRLYGFYQAFQKLLIAELTEKDFADLYAQTIAYGLFTARIHAQDTFDRKLAYSLIPSTLGILRDIFQFLSLGKPPAQMEALVDDIAAVLRAANTQNLLDRYADPIIHFYETFLAKYDPETRERRGVYYTPQPVVRYIVRAVHNLLKTRFNLDDGLSDFQVTLLDPAAGTLTFPAEAIRLAFEEFTSKYGGGAKETLLRDHILRNFYAFELLMPAYTIGHMKIALLLKSLGTPLQDDERFQFYLTNTLDMKDPGQIAIPGLSTLSQESQEASRVKQKPILVILGNPPYSGHSANRNEWIDRLLRTDQDGAQSYYRVDGQELQEKNPKWLQDDYVKFLRFAQWKIQKAGRGIMAMITNHSYLDNPTFRGMRQSLLRTFDEIYILDLHGSSLKRETAPGGGRDENVFHIRQGVAIGIFVRHNNGEKKGVYHAELYGRRQDKYDWLENHTLDSAGYQPIMPQSPYYFFVPRKPQNLQNYHSWPKITGIFREYSVGIVTARDSLTISWTEQEMWDRVEKFSRLGEEAARERFGLGRDARDWKVGLAQRDLKRDGGPRREKIVPILYRPFDIRYTYYTGRSRGFHCMPRPKIMQHMLAGDNLALVTTRQVKASETWQHCFVADKVLESCLVSDHTSEISYVFPLYLYAPSGANSMAGKEVNLKQELLQRLRAAYGFEPTPEQVMAYVYAILYSTAYRRKYAQELRSDFPHVPFTADTNLFQQLAELGQELIKLHLLRSSFSTHSVRLQGEGSRIIEKVRYDAQARRVYINAGRYFEGITPEMWEYRIGGYRVLEKYLKDRKGRPMDDPIGFLHIAEAIARTADLQQRIDALYPKAEKALTLPS